MTRCNAGLPYRKSAIPQSGHPQLMKSLSGANSDLITKLIRQQRRRQQRSKSSRMLQSTLRLFVFQSILVSGNKQYRRSSQVSIGRDSLWHFLSARSLRLSLIQRRKISCSLIMMANFYKNPPADWRSANKIRHRCLLVDISVTSASKVTVKEVNR